MPFNGCLTAAAAAATGTVSAVCRQPVVREQNTPHGTHRDGAFSAGKSDARVLLGPLEMRAIQICFGIATVLFN